MAGASGSISVNLFGHDRTLSKTFQQAWRSADTLSKKMELIGARMSNVGRQMTYGVTVPIVAGFALATKAALEDAKSQEVLRKQIENVTDATDDEVASLERFIDKQARATGVMDDELRPAVGKLVSVTKDLGRAQELLTIAQDTAAGTGRNLDSVITAMMKGQRGSVDLFQRMGIATKDAKGNALSFDQILKRLKATYGGLAATKATPFEKFKVAIAELTESFGRVMLPVVEKLADWFTKLAEKVEGMSPGWRKFITVVALAAAALGPVLMILGAIVTAAPAVGAAFSFMFGPIGLAITAVAALVAGLIILYKKNETFRGIVDSVWAIIKEAIHQVGIVVGWVVDKLGDLWGWVKRNKEPIMTALKVAFWPLTLAVEWIKTWIGWGKRLYGWVKDNWSGIASFLSKAFAPLVWAYNKARDVLEVLGLIEKKKANFSAGGGGGSGGGGGGAGGVEVEPKTGGTFIGPRTGYPATMHGAETVVAHDYPAKGLAQLARLGYLGGAQTVNVYLDGELIESHVTRRQQAKARRNARTWGYAT